MIPLDDLSYAGTWNVGAQRIVAGIGARLRLHYRARNVYVVLGGRGTVHALVDGKPTKTLRVNMDGSTPSSPARHRREGCSSCECRRA